MDPVSIMAGIKAAQRSGRKLHARPVDIAAKLVVVTTTNLAAFESLGVPDRHGELAELAELADVDADADADEKKPRMMSLRTCSTSATIFT